MSILTTGAKGRFIFKDLINKGILWSLNGVMSIPYTMDMDLMPVIWLVMLSGDIPDWARYS